MSMELTIEEDLWSKLDGNNFMYKAKGVWRSAPKWCYIYLVPNTIHLFIILTHLCWATAWSKFPLIDL